MTETVLYIGGSEDERIEGTVLKRKGDVLTVELANGRVVSRHALNFEVVEQKQETEADAEAPRKRGRPRKQA